MSSFGPRILSLWVINLFLSINLYLSYHGVLTGEDDFADLKQQNDGFFFSLQVFIYLGQICVQLNVTQNDYCQI